MHKAKDSRNNPEMPKRATPSVQIPEARSSLQQKRTRSLSSPTELKCSAVPDTTSLKNLVTQENSPTRYKEAGKLNTQRERSHCNQNGSAKKGISDPKGKLVGSPEAEQRSRNGTWRNKNHLGNGGTLERQLASSSSIAARQDVPLEAYSDDDDDAGSILLHNDGDLPPPGKALPEDSQAVEMAVMVQDDPEGVEPLLLELTDDILGRLPMLQVLQLRHKLGKACKNAIHRPAFRRSRPGSEGDFSPSFFMTDDEGDLHWHGFDTKLKKWTRLPSLNFAKTILPSPDPDLFKDYLMAGDGGLLCINVGKATGREKLVICNPLTQKVKELPPLNYPRHPVLMHLKIMDPDSGHYKVIVAGSAAIGTEVLSLKTEEYDSRTGVWECPDGSDLPCPAFGLNEYQNGVYFKDSERELLMCVAIIDTMGRGVLVYDITKKKWAQGHNVKQLHIPLVRSEPNVSHLATTQIVGCGESVFVFSEQECGRDVYFVIHKLIPEGSGDFTWDEVMKRKRTGGRGLLVYPEFTCVPVSDHELCIFNTVEHTIEIIDLLNPTEVTPLQYAPPSTRGNRFHSLNPIGFVFKPSFKSVVCPGELILRQRERRSNCETRDSVPNRTSVHKFDGNCELNNHPTKLSVVNVDSKVDTVPTNETDATENPVQTVARPVACPVEIPGRHHNPCAMAGDGVEVRPKSWDGVLSSVQLTIAAK
ncbi:hypothetical protein KC19_1G005400 [Ceratodon purpureus]|uniref:Uncharacterized protein n=1 Tax=Ceratodon purpureus TaxID=3225 RepID=A0A8T0J2X5_CERPU|nr:hypothetical protein KC19_1G005400 [Ceratodon purpureus]